MELRHKKHMKLPRITADIVIKILKMKGFSLVRQSGSHMIFRNEKGVRVTVPCHSGKILHPKVLKCIMKDAELTTEDF